MEVQDVATSPTVKPHQTAAHKRTTFSTQKTENAEFHHAHVKDAVTLTAVMSWTTSCTRPSMNSTEINTLASRNIMKNGTTTSPHGGFQVVTV